MHEGKYIEEFDTFNMAVDKFFKNFEKVEEKQNIEDIAWKKFENIKVRRCFLSSITARLIGKYCEIAGRVGSV
jgi:hypothetical protein